ncbi:hypothetical protein Amsp01_048510 [Amycolatopsis sp. NBRC 101858]|uniref:BTAD domain-containing putative transcriptional regulator n=1 Tax=Amycolatopsis sp. NBRC 101858 TaxID=3032200 RepID=UPI0024A00C95|nr:BTAD domain-containing putative transcriptional regulator [Amycolatopsis sp. NBRC 101858]GLY38827.1 hypothetical protein Amsp01_048510 [Amycolatopsis sp. NBRC 101858]
MRSIGVLRIALGCGALTTVVAGPPLVLWRIRSVYLPDHVPGVGEASAWLTSPDDGRLFLLLLITAGLVAWLQLVVAIVVEVAARLHGAVTPMLPGFGWAQRIAAALLLVVLSGTAAEAAENPVPGPAPHSHIVAPGENLTKIAAGELGSAARYRELFELNRGTPQADGRSLQDPSLLRPGWILKLPPDEQEDCEEVVVRPGQTLSQIAREELGDAGRYREIFDFNKGRPQPSGRALEDVDQIRPGDVLRIPAPAEPQVGGGGGAPAAAVYTAAAGSCEIPAPPPVPVPKPVEPPPTHSTDPTAAPPEAPAPPAGDNGPSATVTTSIGGLLAAGLVALLALRRRRAQRRRRPGHRIRETPPGGLERDLRSAAQPATVEDLDLALRILARSAREQGVMPPPLQAVKVGSCGVELFLTEPCAPLEPFVAVTKTRWKLDSPAKRDVGEAPYPMLVSLGNGSDHELVLLDLQQVGVMTVDGDRASVEAVILALAWDLAMSPWAERTHVTLVGFGRRSAECHPDRLRYAADWEEALRQDAAAGVFLAADPLREEDRRQLTDLIRTADSAVVTGRSEDVPLPGAWHLDAAAGRTLVEPLGETVELQRLSPVQEQELVAALAAADNPTQVPADGFENVPSEQTCVSPVVQPSPSAASAPATPFLRLLGPVRLDGADPRSVEAKKLNRLTELAAFLALHPGVTADEISLKLGTDAQPWSTATRQGYISRLRTWLGRDPSDELYVPNVDARRGGYRMSESFGCDWLTFQNLARQGLAQPAVSVTDLQQALDLVRGTPFGNIPASRYAWSSWLHREMVDTIVDVAHTLADAYQKTGDLPAARRAAMRGLQAEPVSEILFRDLLRIEYRAGNLAAVRENADKLTALAASLEVELDEETSTLVSSLLRGQA